MSVARTTEISAVSPESFEAAINEGLERAKRTLRQVREAWIKDQAIVLDEDGSVAGYRVRMVITFVLE
jgi:flavin-binding protein dodecin